MIWTKVTSKSVWVTHDEREPVGSSLSADVPQLCTVTSTLVSIIRHNQWFTSTEPMGYETQKSVSYEVQLNRGTRNVQKSFGGKTLSEEARQICYVTEEILSNGTLVR
jgi:hypothetical protein